MRFNNEKMKIYALILLLFTIVYAVLSMSAQVIDKKMNYDGDREEWIERRLLQ
tara:strand:- start:10133 stop:10291 length:159 start_codon:yes stop_codon:yes gene_type:complete